MSHAKILIEIGSTYVCRDGSLFTATGFTDHDGAKYRVVGRDGKDRVTWRSAKGRFTSHPHHLDVVALSRG